jgi:hypothetical protein
MVDADNPHERAAEILEDNGSEVLRVSSGSCPAAYVDADLDERVDETTLFKGPVKELLSEGIVVAGFNTGLGPDGAARIWFDTIALETNEGDVEMRLRNEQY